MTPDELSKKIKISYIKDIEIELAKACRSSVPESIILAALANALVRRSQKEGVDREHFLDLMEKGWDYHEKGEE